MPITIHHDGCNAKEDQGNIKKIVNSFFIQVSNKTADAIQFIILPVPVIKKNTNGIDQKKAAANK